MGHVAAFEEIASSETCSKATQTTSILSADSPRKHRLRTLIGKKRKEIYSLKSKMSSMRATISVSPRKLKKIPNATRNLLEDVVSEDLLTFIQKQVKLSTVKKHGRRYDESLKALAISIYHISGKAYRFLAKLFHLPSKKTITNAVSKFASGVGFSEKSLLVIKQRVEALQPSARVCTLIMDEISLKANLYYDCSKDCIIGFEDFGDGQTSGQVANSALVLMVRGLISKWKQPVAYYLANESVRSGHLRTIISKALFHLEEMGLNVVSVVSDQGSNFIRFFDEMGVTEDKPYFEMRGKNYFTIYDPPHLLKSVRNNLLKYIFQYEEHLAKWSDIEKFYRKEEKEALRLAPKLTEKHINLTGFSKMKVKLATQVLSHSVAAAINTYVRFHALPLSASGTALLLEKFDRIFDCCNASSFKDPKTGRRPITSTSLHVQELTDALSFIKSIKVVNCITKENRTSQIKCLTGWCITIRSILGIWKKLQQEENISFLVTRQLNQDPIENFFGCIRQQGGNSDNPTPIQFIRAYRKLFHINLLSVVSGNCEADKNNLLVNIEHLEQNRQILSSITSPPTIIIDSTDYASEDFQKEILKNNAVSYVAGYLLRKTFAKHKCDDCSALATGNLDFDQGAFLFFKAYNNESNLFGGLVAPSELMITFTLNLEDEFTKHMQTLRKTAEVGKELLHKLEKIKLDVHCEEFDRKYLLMLFIRLRIYYCLKFANRVLEKPKKRKNRKYIKVRHL